MDFTALEFLEQRFVEMARIREKRKPRFRQNTPRIGEDFKEVITQQRLTAGKENVVNAIRRARV